MITLSVKIGHASIDEKGKTIGTLKGDQTKKEIFTRDWYNGSWNVYLECIDPVLAKKSATILESICSNNNYGYSQPNRWSGYKSIINNSKNISKGSGDFDCSSLIISSYILAGLDIEPTGYTGNMRKLLLSTGKFIEYTDKKYLTSDKYASIGGIYIKEGKHVVMALGNGYLYNKSNIIADGQKLGNNFVNTNIDEDGIRGPETKKLGIKVLQLAMNKDYKKNLSLNGIRDNDTVTALGEHYVKYGEKQYMVTAAEILLMLKGYDPKGVEFPGIFGKGLLQVVKQYQKDNSLPIKNVVDSDMFKHLIK